MKLKTTLVEKKFIVILVMAFTVFVLSWLYGQQDFWVEHVGTCSNVWNPKEYIYKSEGYGSFKLVGLKWSEECAIGARDKKFTILFVSGMSFVVLLITYFLFILKSSGNEKN